MDFRTNRIADMQENSETYLELVLCKRRAEIHELCDTYDYNNQALDHAERTTESFDVLVLLCDTLVE